MSAEQLQDSRQAVAERNVEAILDSAEGLLQSGKAASISAVASAAGVSRVTVYSHFKDRRQLLEALVERTVRHAVAALESAEPERGDAIEALQRVVAAGWEQLALNEAIGHASASQLNPDAMHRAHGSVRAVLTSLAERGSREGAFRRDLPVDWLVTSCLALIHAAADEVRAGRLDRDAGLEALRVTVSDLFAGPGR